MNLDDIEYDIKVIDDSFYHRVFETNKVDKEYDNIREAIIIEKNKLRNIIFDKCVIIKIVYKYLNRYIRLQFKKYIINLREIILKLHAYINCSNENIIEKYKNYDDYIN